MVNDLVTLDTESRQGDFAVTIKVRNGRLLSVLRAAGFRSINAFCKKNGMSNNVIGAYVTLTRSPIQSVGENAGQPTKAALDIADRLGVRVEDMFPVGFLARCLARVANATEIPMTAGQIAMLIQEPPRTPEDIIATRRRRGSPTPWCCCRRGTNGSCGCGSAWVRPAARSGRSRPSPRRSICRARRSIRSNRTRC
jgi:hypothetical protein